jgi:hypothetical protein
MDQVRIPWCGRNNSNLQEVSFIPFRGAVGTYNYEEEDLVKPKRSGERVVAEGQGYRRRYRVLEVTVEVRRLYLVGGLCLHTPRHSHTPFLVVHRR